jgi:DNA/RNA endonuclease G (NUC1)
MGLGGAASYFYLRQQQQRVAKTAGSSGVLVGATHQQLFKHGKVFEHTFCRGREAARFHHGRISSINARSFSLIAGMPVGDRLRLFSGFAVSFDTRLRNPRWVLEHITPGKLAVREGNRSSSDFREDKGG